MSTATANCSNPRCTCSPCTCGDVCRCGLARLGDLERRVMDVLWSAPGAELTGRAVADRLGEYAYTTVATVLDRLAHKGEVRRRTDGRVKLYAATGTAGTHVARAMRDALDTAEDPLEALRVFVTSIPADQVEILRTALRRAGRRGPAAAS